jgi:hypothetical protein
MDPDKIAESGLGLQCVTASYAAVAAARKAGLPRLHVVAGTAYWHQFTEGGRGDDGGPSRVGFEWQGRDHPDVKMQLAAKTLPEMHAWLVCPALGAFIDIACAGFTLSADEIGRPEWPLGSPPTAVCWSPEPGHPEEIIDSGGNVRATYRVSGGATRAAAAILAMRADEQGDHGYNPMEVFHPGALRHGL